MCCLCGSSQGGKYGGLFRSLRYVAMMDGRRTSARVSIGHRKRKRREEREMVRTRTSSSDCFRVPFSTTARTRPGTRDEIPPALDAPQIAPQIAVPQPTARYGRDGPAGIRGRGPEHQRNDRVQKEMPAHKKTPAGMTPQINATRRTTSYPPTPNDRSTQHLCLQQGDYSRYVSKGRPGRFREGGGCVGPATTTNERVNVTAAAFPTHDG
jgi:hypothetical protein